MVERAQPQVIVYGAPASLYTAKVRAYLRANRIDYVEHFPSVRRYREVIRPAVETHRIPVVEFPDGETVQDSTLILDAFERRFPSDADAALGPRQRLATHLLESLADRGLAKPAMHFRWNFLEINGDFIVGEFGRSLAFSRGEAEIGRLGRRVASKMAAYLPTLGVVDRIVPTIEATYAETLRLLSAHFAAYPFLLGGAPTRGDFAMMGPLYGHLARDPYPLQLMQRTAPLVFRWTERVNAGERGAPEFPSAVDAPLQNDEVPATLIAVMRHLFDGFGDELVQGAARYNAWVAEHPSSPPGALVSIEGADQPTLGAVVVNYHGVVAEQQAQAHPLWLLQRALDFVNGLDEAERHGCEALIRALGAEGPMGIRLQRRLTRVRNRLAVA